MYFGFFFSSQQQELSSKVFAHLCEVVDDNKQFYDDKIHQILKLIILEGKNSWQNSQKIMYLYNIYFLQFTSFHFKLGSLPYYSCHWFY